MSVSIRAQPALVAPIALGLAFASCAGPDNASGDSSAIETPWAHQAVELFDSIARNLTDAEGNAAAEFFSVRGVLSQVRAGSGSGNWPTRWSRCPRGLTEAGDAEYLIEPRHGCDELTVAT